MKNFEYIKDEKSLKEFFALHSKSNFFAIDTEFIRENYYYPRLGIIQIASEEGLSIIDPLKIKDFTPLIEILKNENIIKIFHASREDISVLYSSFKVIPFPVFDTQIGAAFCGFEDQISYAKLVNAVTGKGLKKFESYTDWLQRPLSKEQIEYALDDVRYLGEIYLYLDGLLKKFKRQEWAKEEFASFTDEELYKQGTPEEQFSKLINQKKFRGRARNILLDLLTWREEKARDQDKMRKAILRDDVLSELAMRCPDKLEDLNSVPGFFPKNVSKYGKEILNIIKEAKKKKMPHKKPYKTYKIPEGLVNLITAFIKEKASQENIAYGVLARRSDIEDFIHNYISEEKTYGPLFQGWRKVFIGEDVKRIVEGKISVGFSRKENKLKLFPVKN